MGVNGLGRRGFDIRENEVRLDDPRGGTVLAELNPSCGDESRESLSAIASTVRAARCGAGASAESLAIDDAVP